MAKSKSFTLDDLEKKGFVKNSQGEYEKNVSVVKKSIKVDSIGEIVAKQPIVNTLDFVFNPPLESFFTIDGLIAGLNGSKGLMNSHWTSGKKKKDFYRQLIREQVRLGKIRQHKGQVKVTYIGYKSILMDWDNFASSAKFPMDSLVNEKIIIDDKPKIVVEFLPKQIKCKRVDQKVIIIIEDVQTT